MCYGLEWVKLLLSTELYRCIKNNSKAFEKVSMQSAEVSRRARGHVGYLLGVFFRLWIPFLVHFQLLLGASTEPVCANKVTTIGYLLGIFFRLWIPFLVRISTSA